MTAGPVVVKSTPEGWKSTVVARKPWEYGLFLSSGVETKLEAFPRRHQFMGVFYSVFLRFPPLIFTLLSVPAGGLPCGHR